MNLLDPNARRHVLESIRPEQAKRHHALLRQIFLLEMEYRSRDHEVDDDSDLYENLYWCGFLLFMVGDPSDVPMMWEAKHINMDTGVGFDIQTLFGAGYDETVAYLRANDVRGILGELDSYADDLSWLEQWRVETHKRFYPDPAASGRPG